VLALFIDTFKSAINWLSAQHGNTLDVAYAHSHPTMSGMDKRKKTGHTNTHTLLFERTGNAQK